VYYLTLKLLLTCLDIFVILVTRSGVVEWEIGIEYPVRADMFFFISTSKAPFWRFRILEQTIFISLFFSKISPK